MGFSSNFAQCVCRPLGLMSERLSAKSLHCAYVGLCFSFGVGMEINNIIETFLMIILLILTYIWLPKENKSQIDNFFIACYKCVKYLLWNESYRDWVKNIRYLHTNLEWFIKYKLTFYNKYNSNNWIKRKISLLYLTLLIILLVRMLLMVIFS